MRDDLRQLQSRLPQGADADALIAALQALPEQLSRRFTSGLLAASPERMTPSFIQGAVAQAKANAHPAAAGSTQDLQAQGIDPAIAQNIATRQSVPDTSATPAGALSEEARQFAGQLVGTDWNSFYQHFADNYAIAVQNKQITSAGYLPTGTPQFWKPDAQGNAAFDPQSQMFSPIIQKRYDVRDPEAQQAAYDARQAPKPTEQMALTYLQHSAAGAAGIAMDNYARDWAYTYNEEMPADLRAQILAALQAAPQSVLDYLVQDNEASTSASSTTAGRTTIPQFVLDVESQWLAQHPTPGSIASTEAKVQQTRLSNFISDYTNRYGAAPDAGVLAKIPGMTEQDITTYLDTQAYRGGLNYRQYQDQLARLKPLWQDAYGQAPSDQAIAWANGKSIDEITSMIDNSPSHVQVGGKPLSIGRYRTLKTQADKVSQQNWGTGATDDVVAAIHKALT
jgi:hypothetical protein